MCASNLEKVSAAAQCLPCSARPKLARGGSLAPSISRPWHAWLWRGRGFSITLPRFFGGTARESALYPLFVFCGFCGRAFQKSFRRNEVWNTESVCGDARPSQDVNVLCGLEFQQTLSVLSAREATPPKKPRALRPAGRGVRRLQGF